VCVQIPCVYIPCPASAVTMQNKAFVVISPSVNFPSYICTFYQVYRPTETNSPFYPPSFLLPLCVHSMVVSSSSPSLKIPQTPATLLALLITKALQYPWYRASSQCCHLNSLTPCLSIQPVMLKVENACNGQNWIDLFG
jgi:hypothetical protein